MPFTRRIAIAALLVGSIHIARAEVQPWIVGGELVAVGQRRAVASVVLPGGYCTGVLVAPDLVLTAGHCLAQEGSPVEAEAVVLGSTKLFETDDAGSERILVSRSIKHPTEDLGLLVARPSVDDPADSDHAGLCTELPQQRRHRDGRRLRRA